MSTRDRLTDFERGIGSLRLIGHGSRRNDAESIRGRLIGLVRDKLRRELNYTRPLMAVVAGGTNVGKSTLVNGVVRDEVTTVSVLARGTKTPVLCGSERTTGRLGTYGFLDEVRLIRMTGSSGTEVSRFPAAHVVATGDFPPDGMLLIDSPDMDSEYDANRAWAVRLVDTADIVVLVVTPEKYHDEIVFRFLERSVQMGRTVCAVFNKAMEPDAFDDFIASVWRPVTGKQPVFMVEWVSDNRRNDERYVEIREHLSSLGKRESAIKRTALRGTMKVITEETLQLMELFKAEQHVLSDVQNRIDAAMDNECMTYRREIAGDTFKELDRVFERLLFELRIPILDDFYAGIRSVGRTVWHHVGRLTGFSMDERDEKHYRDSREVDRVLDSSASLRTELEGIFQQLPRDLRPYAQEWLESLPARPKRRELDPFLEILDARIEDWVRKETEEISRRLEGKPGLRKFIITMKATLQIGSGVMGAVLTGGLEPADLAIAPVVERMSAYLIERGIGYSYFRRSRVRLLDARTRCLRDFLMERYVQPLKDVIPKPDEQRAVEVMHQLDAIVALVDEVNHA